MPSLASAIKLFPLSASKWMFSFLAFKRIFFLDYRYLVPCLFIHFASVFFNRSCTIVRNQLEWVFINLFITTRHERANPKKNLTITFYLIVLILCLGIQSKRKKIHLKKSELISKLNSRNLGPALCASSVCFENVFDQYYCD